MSKGKSRKKSTQQSKPKNPSKAVSRSSKILRDEKLERKAWTRTFVSGPMDPRWNPYKVYCQNCKGNISIYGWRAKEVLRRHSTDSHLRKDQRWRYEHLAEKDLLTKAIHHQVRDGKGHILAPNDLLRQYMYLKGAELVNIGKSCPTTTRPWLVTRTCRPRQKSECEYRSLIWATSYHQLVISVSSEGYGKTFVSSSITKPFSRISIATERGSPLVP